eukprot:364542-Chlamydomonas_euryale.AAC.6
MNSLHAEHSPKCMHQSTRRGEYAPKYALKCTHQSVRTKVYAAKCTQQSVRTKVCNRLGFQRLRCPVWCASALSSPFGVHTASTPYTPRTGCLCGVGAGALILASPG